MQVDPKEAARRLRAWNEYGEGADSGTPNEPGYTHDSLDFQRDLRALLSERDAAVARAEAAERERDALRDEWEEIAAGITTEQPEVGALWPMVSEISGGLAAVRNLFKNEVTAHNRTKAQRDAATAERDRLREALEDARVVIQDDRADLVDCDTIPDANEWRDESTMGDLTKAAVAHLDKLLAKVEAALAGAAKEAGTPCLQCDGGECPQCEGNPS